MKNDKVNFEPSGLLSKHENALNGVHLKYSRPDESCKPKKKWKLYHFKSNISTTETSDRSGSGDGTDTHTYFETISLYSHEYYLIGSDSRVVDIKIRNDSIDDQHAVIQHKLSREGKPAVYLVDLESLQGTYINGERIESRRYYQLLEKDVIKFGTCNDEFVLLNEEMSE